MAGLALATSACTPGAYSIDIFRELHYQPSQRLQEPNRLAPPAGAVPAGPGVNQLTDKTGISISGRSPAITFAQADSLQNPTPNNDQTRQQGQQLFDVNCAVCHGQNADGKSPVADRFTAAGAVPPVDFTSDRARSRSDGQLYWILTYGVGNMPPFGDLLTDNQRWALVHFIRNKQQGQ